MAFRQASSWPLLIVQHLLLGINAHINLDLGIAAAETSPGADLPALRRDFNEINGVLRGMLDDVQVRIAGVSPWFGVLDMIGMRTDEEIFTFGLNKSRELAWKTALNLNQNPRVNWSAQIDVHDRAVTALAIPIYNPGLSPARCAAGRAGKGSCDVSRVIEALSVA